jgi:hypothetical protein
LKDRQDLMLRSHLLLGESLLEMLTGPMSGVVRLSPIEPGRIDEVQLRGGNAWWPIGVTLDKMAGGDSGRQLSVVEVNDFTGLREGKAMFWASVQDARHGRARVQLPRADPGSARLLRHGAVEPDRPYGAGPLHGVGRHRQGDQGAVDKFVADRRGTHVPPSGSVEVHNDSVKWEPKTVSTGAFEDAAAAQNVLTQIAAGGSGEDVAC